MAEALRNLGARLRGVLSGDGLKARTLRGTFLSVAGFGGSQVIRLASNLVLTRILFPEAFGLMALVQVFLAALEMFSDMAIGTSVVRSPRGDDPAFLRTAWTLQIVRGVVLFTVACILAVPVAGFYEQPELALMIPVVAVSTLIGGLASVRLYTANRHLTLERLTFLELGSQILGTLAMIGLALWLQSVWALVFGTLIGIAFKTVLSHLLLPGAPDRLGWDRAASLEIFHFGKYIFLGTIAGFFIQNGDRTILGKFVSLEELAVYSIALTLAMVPLTLNFQLINRVLLPLYRNRPPGESAKNRADIGRVLLGIRAGLVALTSVLAVFAEPLIGLLYDDRYQLAGPLLALLAIANIPRMMIGGYDSVLLAAGNSRQFTILLVTTALLTTASLYLGVSHFGLPGAIIAPVVAGLLTYPLLVGFIRPYGAWYPKMDLLLCLAIVPLAVLTLWNNPGALTILTGTTAP